MLTMFNLLLVWVFSQKNMQYYPLKLPAMSQIYCSYKTVLQKVLCFKTVLVYFFTYLFLFSSETVSL